MKKQKKYKTILVYRCRNKTPVLFSAYFLPEFKSDPITRLITDETGNVLFYNKVYDH